jgi:muconolactone delta-isomerase
LAHQLPPLIQQAMQIVQSGQMPPPMDPAQVAMQDVQARAQAKAQELQLKQQDSMLRAKMNAEDNSVKVAMNDADNATALQLKQMSIAEHAVRTAHDPNPMPNHRTSLDADPAGSHNPSPAGMV